jgi:dCMP deaminase
MMDKWDLRYLKLAEHVATWSKDPTTQVGAVVVGRNKRNVAVGYNGFPEGIADLPERYAHRPTKYLYTQHAERNVLDNASFGLRGATLATTMFPCVECTKSIISKGVTKLITPPVPEPIAEPSWRDDCETSLAMLREAGVRIIIIYQGIEEPDRKTGVQKLEAF